MGCGCKKNPDEPFHRGEYLDFWNREFDRLPKYLQDEILRDPTGEAAHQFNRMIAKKRQPMMKRNPVNRSQDSYLRTGNANEYRVRGERGNWWVEGTDNNRVWVDAEPGFRYATKSEARAAAHELASQKEGGKVVNPVKRRKSILQQIQELNRDSIADKHEAKALEARERADLYAAQGKEWERKTALEIAKKEERLARSFRRKSNPVKRKKMASPWRFVKGAKPGFRKLENLRTGKVKMVRVARRRSRRNPRRETLYISRTLTGDTFLVKDSRGALVGRFNSLEEAQRWVIENGYQMGYRNPITVRRSRRNPAYPERARQSKLRDSWWFFVDQNARVHYEKLSTAKKNDWFGPFVSRDTAQETAYSIYRREANPITVRRPSVVIKKERAGLWEWRIVQNGKTIAGGYTASKRHAQNDAGIWMKRKYSSNPITVRRLPHSSRYRVTGPHGVHAQGTSYQKAEAQASLLRGTEHGWRPSGRKGRRYLRPNPKRRRSRSAAFYARRSGRKWSIRSAPRGGLTFAKGLSLAGVRKWARAHSAKICKK